MRGALAGEIDVALRCAVAASTICQTVQREMITQDAVAKADRSPVTLADYGSQAIVCRLLKQAFASDLIVAEETAEMLRGPENAPLLSRLTGFVRSVFPDATEQKVCEWIDHGTHQTAARYWCLDPIDGTKGFLRGDQYAVALALVIRGQVHLGVLACPNLPVDLEEPEGRRGLIFMAVKEEGAFQMALGDTRRVPIRVSSARTAAEVRFCESLEESHADHEAHSVIGKRLGILLPPIRMDSQAKYGIVARGDASVYLRLPSPETPDYREKIWDHAAGSILVEEAGGRVTDTSGRSLNFGFGRELIDNRGVIATNGLLHEDVLAALRSADVGPP